MIVEKAAIKKKYLKFKISNLFKRYVIIKNKKNLKNNIDFINLCKLPLSYSPKYKDLIRIKPVEKKIIKKNKKIILVTKLNLISKILDFK